MLTHEDVVKAIRRASTDAGFVILQQRQLAKRNPKYAEIALVPQDRLHLAPPREATFALRHPDVLLTEIDIQGFPSTPGSQGCSQVDLTITYHIPYPAYLGLDHAIVAARAVRSYLIEALALNPPPRWAGAKEADQEDLTNLFDTLFSVNCTLFESGGAQRGIAIRLDQIWVFEQDQPANEAEIEGESESMMAIVEYVWRILLPPAYRADPLAPLSFLFPEAALPAITSPEQIR